MTGTGSPVPAVTLRWLRDYLPCMTSLTPLDTCLAQALNGTAPVPDEVVDPSGAGCHVLAADLRLPQDMPRATEALRAGYAVDALDLVGASVGNPVSLHAPVRVLPGTPLPPGTDAVLPEDGIDSAAGPCEAIRSASPGEGARRAGHDGRKGAVILAAGRRIAPRHRLLAELAGIDRIAIRRPRIRILLDDPRHGAFVQGWMQGLGAVIVEDAPHLTLRAATDHRPRLALAPAETAWLERDGTGLVLTVPIRFDGVVAACLALALPAMAALTGAMARPATRQLLRKVTSTVGLSELVLLAREDDAWVPHPAGTVTLTALATAEAFGVLPPDSEGLPAGAPLAALPLDLPFG
jgi:molybdopterin molybdotransferase